MTPDGTFHRWGADYLTRREWPNAPEENERVRRALGSVSVEDARHLLSPIVSANSSGGAPGATCTFEDLPHQARLELRLRFARSVEMRLVAQGRQFGSREVWRAVYALGLKWGDMDVFHWVNPAAPSDSAGARFAVSSLGDPVYFLPERAEEGGTVAGLIISFELPTCPAPLAVYDRMAIAISYLRQKIGGHPTAVDGDELDHDRLFNDRDTLALTIGEMATLGVAPGSAAARRLL